MYGQRWFKNVGAGGMNSYSEAGWPSQMGFRLFWADHGEGLKFSGFRNYDPVPCVPMCKSIQIVQFDVQWELAENLLEVLWPETSRLANYGREFTEFFWGLVDWICRVLFQALSMPAWVKDYEENTPQSQCFSGPLLDRLTKMHYK